MSYIFWDCIFTRPVLPLFVCLCTDYYYIWINLSVIFNFNQSSNTQGNCSVTLYTLFTSNLILQLHKQTKQSKQSKQPIQKNTNKQQIGKYQIQKQIRKFKNKQTTTNDKTNKQNLQKEQTNNTQIHKHAQRETQKS